MQFATIKPTFYLPQRIFLYIYANSKALFHTNKFQVYYFAPTASAFSKVKRDVKQSKATFHNVLGFATVYCRRQNNLFKPNNIVFFWLEDGSLSFQNNCKYINQSCVIQL